MFVGELDEKQKLALADRITAQPYDFVAQGQVGLSRIPVWEYGNLDTRSLVLRAYVLNTGHGWTVMPGGLERSALPDAPLSLSEHRAKQVAPKPAQPFTPSAFSKRADLGAV